MAGKSRKIDPSRYIIFTRSGQRCATVVKRAEILTRCRRLINDIYDRCRRSRETFEADACLAAFRRERRKNPKRFSHPYFIFFMEFLQNTASLSRSLLNFN